jgi:DNA polymerase
MIDIDLVRQAVKQKQANIDQIKNELKELTGLDNPNSHSQFGRWLREQGLKVTSCAKPALNKLLEDKKTQVTVKEVIRLRLGLSNSSLAKYDKMLLRETKSRLKGEFSFYGGGRTGRWAGRGVQLQNMPRDKAKKTVRERLLAGGCTTNAELKTLIRTAIVPKQDCEFVVADFSAIEARILAWLADEKDTLDAFRRGEDIYKLTAAKMYHTSPDKINSEQRQRGKVAVLACGYQGSIGALSSMCETYGLDLTDEQKQNTVNAWRKANPNIVKLWSSIELTAKSTMRYNRPNKCNGIELSTDKAGLWVRLPSGRSIAYQKAKVANGNIEFLTQRSNGLMNWEQTYGGKLVENIVQAIARDLLAEAMLSLNMLGYNIVAHIHDEVILEEKTGTTTAEEICEVMSDILPLWAKGLPLSAEGYICEEYYEKK